jgi:hypothetical protein
MGNENRGSAAAAAPIDDSALRQMMGPPTAQRNSLRNPHLMQTELYQDLNSGNWLITVNGEVRGIFGRCDRDRAEKAYARLRTVRSEARAKLDELLGDRRAKLTAADIGAPACDEGHAPRATES